MSTAPSMPASVPGYLLPASPHSLLSEVGEVLRRLDARAAVEQVSNHSTHLLSRQLGVLSRTSCRRLACGAGALQQSAAASITRHHPEAP
ncbi:MULTISPECIES: hypothetical protein [Xanthomonas]|uniref:Uncharacterized protein n=1 Tax=Xanthomonas arboricola pv. corylina TaxID=487821 RepID=A0A8D6V8N4_9XANT|nr:MULTISPECIES: hypothetical protein [Xanthomonas]KPN08819.1 hypothetical protein AN651_03605 [Xanthomonas arboricola]MEA0737539.1 hypothetical protein [Xanthomonas campestris pv. campestris]CAE6698408.1 hypothetical protein CFBP1159_03610 [Xanthomonas arboricola pv. corylina]CAE6698428.1 hypothetical protein CFBP1159_03610 [Xanthomonas arboricola pv. corylina]CAE6787645.1 hypothetical protein XAC301_25590 [Xanthomonas arboricola pv. corylina]